MSLDSEIFQISNDNRGVVGRRKHMSTRSQIQDPTNDKLF